MAVQGLFASMTQALFPTTTASHVVRSCCLHRGGAAVCPRVYRWGRARAPLKLHPPGNAHPPSAAAPAAHPAAHNLGTYHGTWEIIPLVNHSFEWGVVVIATFLSVLSIVPRHCVLFDLLSSPKLEEN